MDEKLNFSFFNNIFKLEITFLIDLVAVAGFFTYTGSFRNIGYILPLLISGSLASMASGVFNNIYDTDIDAKMPRVSNRRQVVSANRGKMIALLIILFTSSMIVGFRFLNYLSVVFIILGFISYAFLYTVVLKRRTDLNIVFGGIAGSFPALAGSAAINGTITPAAIFIAILVFVWTPTHFWSLAIKYKDDYKEANIPMLPAVKGISVTRSYILLNSVFLAIITIFPFVYPKIGLNLIYGIASIPLALWILIPSYYYFRKKGEAREYRKLFSYTNGYLTLALILIIISSFSITF
ncbi:MAG: heme o synthase [Cuniculiplasma sp.]